MMKTFGFSLVIFTLLGITFGEEMKCGPSGNVSIENPSLGQPWTTCFNPGTESVLRLSISHRNDFTTCTQDSSFWSIGGSMPTNIMNATCPGPGTAGMCLTVFSGSTHDIGWWHFAITDGQTGSVEILCSTFLILETWDYPWLKSKCIDFQNPLVALYMDFEEESDVDFNSSISYKDGKHLCYLHREEQCNGTMKAGKCHHYFACNVSRAVIEEVLEMYGNNVADNATVTYQSKNVNRTTRTANSLEVKKECRVSMHSDPPEGKSGIIGFAEILGLIFSMLILIFAVACYLYKKGKFAKCISLQQLMMMMKRSNNEHDETAGSECSSKLEVDPESEEDPESEVDPESEEDPESEMVVKPVKDSNHIIKVPNDKAQVYKSLPTEPGLDDLEIDIREPSAQPNLNHKLMDKPVEDTGTSKRDTIIELR